MYPKKYYFRYDIQNYKKKLLKRFAIVGFFFCVFLVWNYAYIPQFDRKEFLTIFIPLIFLLGIFLYRNFNRQVGMLQDITLEISGKVLKQYVKNEESNQYDLSGLEKICMDEYKSYQRVILEWEDTAMTFVNLEDSEFFVKTIESITNLRREIFPKKYEILSIQALYYIIPSIIYGLIILLIPNQNIPYLNWKTFLLFLNINLIIYVLYGIGTEQGKYESKYQTRRKLLFILLVLFVYQVIANFSSSLGLY